MTIYNWLCLLGIPSAVIAIVKWAADKFKSQASATEAMKLGLQALLRAQMIGDYNRWSERGYAPIYAKENFENEWKQYEALGANGVMNSIHQKFLELPDTKKE